MDKGTRLIVTHHNPDLDAICSVWLIKRFWPHWKEAAVEYVPAGETYQGMDPDTDPNIIHVDTGQGQFDHHQTMELTCSADQVLAKIRADYPDRVDEALERLVVVVREIDHFLEVAWPEPENDRYEFMLSRILDGWQGLARGENDHHLNRIMGALDGVYQALKDKVWADRELSEKGVVFQTRWGEGVGIESINDEALVLAQKRGYVMAVRKDPRKKYLRIKAVPTTDIDLTPVHEKLKEADSEASWFLHVSKRMLLNGSTRNPEMRPTDLSLAAVIEIIETELG